MLTRIQFTHSKNMRAKKRHMTSLKTNSYAAYLKDVEPLLSGPPQVTALTPMWSKGA